MFYIYFTHQYRGSVYQLMVDTKEHEVHECCVKVGEIDEGSILQNMYMVVPDPDIMSAEPFYLTLQPYRLIGEKFLTLCSENCENDETVEVTNIHEPSNIISSLNKRYCDHAVFSNGETTGAVVIDTSQPYPLWMKDLPCIKHPEDYVSLIYIHKL
jgi:hypothetical protein